LKKRFEDSPVSFHTRFFNLFNDKFTINIVNV
jgi:hypothetical protein